MLVFYSGIGQWEELSKESGKWKPEPITVAMEECRVFKLPEKYQKEIKYKGSAQVNKLLACPEHPDGAYLISDPDGSRHPDAYFSPVDDLSITKDDIINIQVSEIVEIEKPLSESERKSLLKLVYGMAKAAYRYDPKENRSSVTGMGKDSIYADLDRVGLSMDVQTIRKYLKEASEIFLDQTDL